MTSSAYSRSPPTGRPRAIRVTRPHVARQALGEVHRGGVALEGRVRGEDHLGHGLAVVLGGDHALEQLADPQALRADPVHRADRPVQDVVAAPPLAGPLDREHVEGLLDHAQAARVATRVPADRALAARR